MNKVLPIAATMLAATMTGRGEDVEPPRPITSEYALEVGAATDIDTYLSPLKYHGVRTALSGKWSKMMPVCPQRLRMEFNAMIGCNFTRNPSHTARLYDASAMFDWGMQYIFTPASDWKLGAGGSVGISGGVMYLPRNGNNPATAKADIMFSLRASVAWTTKIGGLPVEIADNVRLPSLGAFFSQEYGESYYEIYLGDYSGLVNFGWWGNHFGIDNHLTATFRFPSRSLTVGYRFMVDSSWINRLNTQRVSHSVTVGVTFGGSTSKLSE